MASVVECRQDGQTRVDSSCMTPQISRDAGKVQPRTTEITRASRSSVLLIERGFTVLVGHLLADLGDLGAHLEHDALDAAPGRKIATRRAACRQAGQGGQGDTGNACIDICPAHRFALLLHQAQLQHLGLDLDVISIRLTAWR
jgi:hypothetical protein